MFPSTITRWLRRPALAATILAVGLLSIAGSPNRAQAQYYPYYAYNPYYSGYCDPYYNPYACGAGYAYPGYAYGYGYPYYGYGVPVGLGWGWGRGWGHGGFRGGGFHGGGGRGGGHHR